MWVVPSSSSERLRWRRRPLKPTYQQPLHVQYVHPFGNIISHSSKLVACKSLLDEHLTASSAVQNMEGAAGCIPWAVIATFLTDYLAVDGGLGPGLATFIFATFGVGSQLSVPGKDGIERSLNMYCAHAHHWTTNIT